MNLFEVLYTGECFRRPNKKEVFVFENGCLSSSEGGLWYPLSCPPFSLEDLLSNDWVLDAPKVNG